MNESHKEQLSTKQSILSVDLYSMVQNSVNTAVRSLNAYETLFSDIITHINIIKCIFIPNHTK
jgi:hypothetical protein